MKFSKLSLFSVIKVSTGYRVSSYVIMVILLKYVILKFVILLIILN